MRLIKIATILISVFIVSLIVVCGMLFVDIKFSSAKVSKGLQLKVDPTKHAVTKTTTYLEAKDNSNSVIYAFFGGLVESPYSPSEENTDKRTQNAFVKDKGVDRNGKPLGYGLVEDGEKVDRIETKILVGLSRMQKVDNEWRMIKYGTTTKDAYNLQVNSGFIRRVFGQTTTTPAIGAASPIDGSVSRSVGVDTSVTFENVRMGNCTPTQCTSGAVVTGTNALIRLREFAGTIDRWAFHRVVTLFDTSALSGTVISADIQLWTEALEAQAGAAQDYVAIVGTCPLANTGLVGSDYLAFTDTSVACPFATSTAIRVLSSKTFLTNATTSEMSRYILNANGRAGVNVDGVSKFGATTGWDIEDTATAEDQNRGIQISLADIGIISQTPTLTVTTEAVASLSLIHI